MSLGIFVYNLIVVFFDFSAYAGALALLLILVPIIGRASEEILKMVPHHIREAGLALGLPRWKVIVKILIPGTLTMLLSGVILSIARIAGETAPSVIYSFRKSVFFKKFKRAYSCPLLFKFTEFFNKWISRPRGYGLGRSSCLDFFCFFN